VATTATTTICHVLLTHLSYKHYIAPAHARARAHTHTHTQRNISGM